MSSARSQHTASVLANGKVLLTGGSVAYAMDAVNTAELYDPSTGRWTTTGNMSTARRYHSASLLVNGKVLVTGGAVMDDLNTAELYDPSTESWTTTGSMSAPRYMPDMKAGKHNNKTEESQGLISIEDHC